MSGSSLPCSILPQYGWSPSSPRATFTPFVFSPPIIVFLSFERFGFGKWEYEFGFHPRLRAGVGISITLCFLFGSLFLSSFRVLYFYSVVELPGRLFHRSQVRSPMESGGCGLCQYIWEKMRSPTKNPPELTADVRVPRKYGKRERTAPKKIINTSYFSRASPSSRKNRLNR